MGAGPLERESSVPPSGPDFPVEGAVLDGFRDVGDADGVGGIIEVGDGAVCVAGVDERAYIKVQFATPNLPEPGTECSGPAGFLGQLTRAGATT